MPRLEPITNCLSCYFQGKYYTNELLDNSVIDYLAHNLLCIQIIIYLNRIIGTEFVNESVDVL